MAPRPRGLSFLASLAVAGVLVIFSAQVAIAAIIGMTTNGTNTVTVPASSGNRFFQLRK